MRAFLAALLLCQLPAFAAPVSAGWFSRGFMGPAKAGAPWLKRAMRDVGTNPTGWSHRWCGRYMRTVMPDPISSNRAIDGRHYGRGLKGPRDRKAR